MEKLMIIFTHNTSHNHHHNQQHDHHHQVQAFEEEEDEEEEDEAVGPRSVGLFGLFRYAVMLDFVLILFGSIGALINGGSLPFYSLLFGKFVNKLSLGGTDKKKMMKEVDTVRIFRSFSISLFYTNLSFEKL